VIITKRQLRRIIKEITLPGRDAQAYMDRIDALDEEFQQLAQDGAMFRSAGVRMALEKMKEAFYELGTGMREEMKHREVLDD
jgi:hypothetical protein